MLARSTNEQEYIGTCRRQVDAQVGVLTVSLTSGGGRMETDRTIKLSPATSVLGYAPGDEIAVRRDDFVRLSDAFFADLEKKFH